MNYNSLMNKPTINYRELIGDNTVTEVGGITEEQFSTLLDTDLASYYTKEQIDDLFARSFVYREKSGSIVTFDCPSTSQSIPEVTVGIEATQSGSGDPSPTNVRPISGWSAVNVYDTGVNVWDEEWEVGAINSNNGLDYPSDDTIRSKYFPIRSGTYYFKTPQNCFVFGYNKEKKYIGRVAGYGALKNTLMTINDTNCVFIRFYIDSSYGTTYNNDISINYPSTDTEYHAHNGQTYKVEFKDGDNPLTVYGGTLDVVNGVLTVDRAYFKYTNVSTTSGTAVTEGWRCNFTCPIDDINRGKWSIQTGATPIFNKISVVAKGYGANEYTVVLPNVTSKEEADAMLEGLEICYKLATSLTIQLTPTAVKSLLGTNNLWADCGDIEVKCLDRIIPAGE